MTKINFDKLPIAQQRVEIAKDVIAQLDSKRLRATPGTYLEGLRGEIVPYRLYDAEPDLQVRDTLAGRKCRVCGIGGLFVCAVDKADKLTLGETFGELNDDFLQRDYLGRWFKEQTLREIESAFEGWDMSDFGDFAGRGEHDFSPFLRAVPKADERLRIIASNIIRNKGEFVARQIVREYR